MDKIKVALIKNRTWDPKDIHYWINPADKTCNASIIYKGRRSRLRASMLVIKDKCEILLGEVKNKPGWFTLPGGGFDLNESPVQAAVRETKEEVHILVNNAVDTECDFCEIEDQVQPYVIENVPEDEWWYNYYTCLCIGEYAGPYYGEIDEVDEDPNMENTSKFYPIKEAIKNPTFMYSWKKVLYNFGLITKNDFTPEEHKLEQQLLKEDTRNQLISSSRNVGQYKDKSRGKNRFERKKYSKVAKTVKQYNQIDMNDFFKKDLLQVKVPVVGESDNYNVTVKFEGVITEIQRNIKSNANKFEFKTVIQALTKVFNSGQVYVKCTCDDFKFRYQYWSIVNGWGAGDSSENPGPGKGIANPDNDKGKGCKHILVVLNNLSWLMSVASVIKNYITYIEEKMPKQFLKIIFPKLYGMTPEEALEDDLFDDEKFLKDSNGLIDTINEWAKNRGKFKKGENKNPVAQAKKVVTSSEETK